MDISAQRFAMNGRSMRLPPGFRFDPDDEDLVFEYLAKKVLHRPMDFDLPELRSCNVDPWDLLGLLQTLRSNYSTIYVLVNAV